MIWWVKETMQFAINKYFWFEELEEGRIYFVGGVEFWGVVGIFLIQLTLSLFNTTEKGTGENQGQREGEGEGGELHGYRI